MKKWSALSMFMILVVSLLLPACFPPPPPSHPHSPRPVPPPPPRPLP